MGKTPPTNHRLLLLILFLTFISAGVTITIIETKSARNLSTTTSTPAPTASQKISSNPYQATLTTTNSSPTTLNITLNNQSFDLKNLNAYQLEISFNPKAIKIISISPGDIWRQTNLLSSQIDNQNGNASISIGRGFETKITGKNTLAIVKYQIINSKLSPDIKILNSSQIAIANYPTSVQIIVK